MSIQPGNSVSWPSGSPAFSAASCSEPIERIRALAARYPDDLELLPPATETVADPPPALDDLACEFGGVRRHGITELTLVTEERTDEGPYVLLGDLSTFYPIYETPDMAVVVTIDENGEPGAVYGIGDDLGLQLAARSLPEYLGRLAEALEKALDVFTPEMTDLDERAEQAEQVLEDELYRSVLGMRSKSAMQVIDLEEPSKCGIDQLPAGTVAVADLRTANRDAHVDLIDAQLPGDPMRHHVDFLENGTVVCVVSEE